METKTDKLPMTLAEKLNDGARLEILFAPDERGLEVTLRSLVVKDDPEVLEDVREIHIVLTNHQGGGTVRLRCWERVGGIDTWRDYHLTLPSVFASISNQKGKEGS